MSKNESRNALFGQRLFAGYHDANNRTSIWSVGGYPEQVDFSELWRMYRRNGIAKAVVELIVDECWQSNPVVSGGGDEFQKQLSFLISEHDLWAKMRGLDMRQRVGRYGGIIIVAKEDGSAQSSEALKVSHANALVKLMPVYESQISVNQWNSDMSSADYGMPSVYQYRARVDGARNEGDMRDLPLHPTRVFAYGEGADDGSIYGVSSIESCYNALMDQEKVRAGASEGYLRNAKQRFAIEVKDDNAASVLAKPEMKADFDQNVDDFSKGFDNSLTLYGMEAKSLQSTIGNPKEPFDVCMYEISAAAQVAATIIIGQQTGRLASDEDQKQLAKSVLVRRTQTINSMIKSFFKHMVSVGLLPKPTESIKIEWDSTTYIDDSQKIERAGKMAEANAKSMNAGMGPVYSIEEIRQASGYTKDVGSDIKDEGDETLPEE